MKRLFLTLLLGTMTMSVMAQDEDTPQRHTLFADVPSGYFACWIEGDSITLPCAWEELERIGWRFVDPEVAGQVVAPSTHPRLLQIAPQAAVHTLTGTLSLAFVNLSTDEQPLSACTVFALDTEVGDPASGFEGFTLPGGIVGGKTTGKQLTELYGDPVSTLGIGFISGRKWVHYYYSIPETQSGVNVRVYQQQTEPEDSGLIAGFSCSTEAEIARRIEAQPTVTDEADIHGALLEDGIRSLKRQLEKGDLTQEQQAERMLQIGFGYYQLDEMDKAYEWFLRAAEQGNTEAQYSVGYCYDNGAGTEQDSAAAVQWYTKAAENGHTRAMNNLARCYERGTGVAMDITRAVEWFTRAAEAGEGTAMLNLAYYYAGGKGIPADDDKLFEWAQKAAQEDEEDAYAVVGYCYHYGKGVKRDYMQARRWYDQGTEAGDKTAAFNLAVIFYHGYGVKCNYDQAFRFFQSSVGSVPQAEAALGECYYHGRGTEKDLAQAAQHYRAFLEQSDPSDSDKDMQKMRRKITKLLDTKLKGVE